MVGTVIAIVLVVPAILLPVALVWYVNIAGIQAVKARDMLRQPAAN